MTLDSFMLALLAMGWSSVLLAFVVTWRRTGTPAYFSNLALIYFFAFTVLALYRIKGL